MSSRKEPTSRKPAQRAPSGSSGGEGAIVGAGGVPFGIGLGETSDNVDTAGAIFQSFGAHLVDAKGDIKQIDYVVYKWDAKGNYTEVNPKGS